MGKHKYIESPEVLWNLFLEYGTAVKSHPIKKHDFVGKDACEVWRQIERPLTMEGFRNHLRAEGVITDISHYFSNYENRYTEYLGICSRIKDSIRQDQIEGGMAGIYNPSITQRLNGLVEKTEDSGTKKMIIEVVDGDQAPNRISSTTSGAAENLR